MGLYDDIIPEYPLPGFPPTVDPKSVDWATKSLDCRMGVYKITKDGQLQGIGKFGGITPKWENVLYTGEVSFYTNISPADPLSFEYCSFFESGKLRKIINVETLESIDAGYNFQGKLEALQNTIQSIIDSTEMEMNSFIRLKLQVAINQSKN